MNTALIARRCCNSPDATSLKLAAPSDPAPRLAGPVVSDYDPLPLTRALAFHEAGHAMARIVSGGNTTYVSLTASHPHEMGNGGDGAVYRLAGPAAEGVARGRLFPETQREVLETFNRVQMCAFGTCDECLAMLASLERGDVTNEEKAVANYRRSEAIAMRMVDSEPGRRFLRLAAHELLKQGEVRGAFFHDLAREVLPDNFLETITRSAVSA